MRFESFSKNNFEGLNDESKEYKINYFDNEKSIQSEYKKAVEKLALYKIRNDILFEGKLGSSLRHLTSLGLNVTKEGMLNDIEKEVNRQKYDLNFDNYSYDSTDSVIKDKKQTDILFNSIFNERVNKEVKEDMQTTYNNDEVNDNIQEDDFDKIYEYEIKKLVELKKNNNPSYELELNNSIKKIALLTDKIPNIKSQVESDVDYEINSQNLNQVKNSDIVIENNKNNKDILISQIINKMNQYGELSFGEISINERLNIMQGIRDNLSKKSYEDLEYLLMSYEDNQSNKKHR